MGTLFKKKGSKKWQMGLWIDGRQQCLSTHTSNKRVAKQMLKLKEAEVFEGRYQLTRSRAPRFKDYAEEFLNKVVHPNTRRRYASSVAHLKAYFANSRLSDITSSRIEGFKERRLVSGVGPATVNRDLAALRRMLRLAEKKRFISRTPFAEVELLEERKYRREPHIVTFEEEERILAVAGPHIRILVVLILETGMRSNREALNLKWEDIDFATDSVRIRESKTRAGVRTLPLSGRCKAELLRWHDLVGPQFSVYVFPNMRTPDRPLKDIRRSWAKALRDAKLNCVFWIYNLRHTFASRLSATGLSDLFVAQMMGHSTPTILQTYAKVIDEYRRSAIQKLEEFRVAHEANKKPQSASIN